MSFYVFHAHIPARGASPLKVFSWATAPISENWEHRLLSLPSVSYGFGETSGSLHRTTLTLEVDNTDGALDDLFLGRGSLRRDWTETSLAELRGQLVFYRGPAGIALTPWMKVSASMESAPGRVTLSLTSDSPFIGSVKPKTDAQLWRRSVNGVHGASAWIRDDFSDAETMASFRRAAVHAGEVPIPAVFHSTTLPLFPVDPDREWWIAGEISLADANRATYDLYNSEGELIHPNDLTAPQVAIFTSSESDRLLVAYQKIPVPSWYSGDLSWAKVTEDLYVHVKINQTKPPVSVLQDVIQYATGQAPFLAPEYQAVADDQYPLSNTVGGVIEEDASLADIIEAISRPTGMDVYLGPDEKLHCSSAPSGEELAAVGEATPLIEAAEVFPDERGIPAASSTVTLGAVDFGAPVTSVRIEWPAAHQAVWGKWIGKSVTASKMDIAESELAVSGDWLDPSREVIIRTLLASKGAAPIRSVRLAVSYDFAGLKPGQLVRFRTLANPGREERVGQVRHLEFAGAEACIYLTLADYGPVGSHRVGKLDSYENWIIYEATSNADAIDLHTGSQITMPVHVGTDPGMVGGTIWVLGASDPRNNRSYEIVEVVDATRYEVSPQPVTGEFNVRGAGAWLLMATRQIAPDYRPDYICGAKPDTGLFRYGGEGFEFSS